MTPCVLLVLCVFNVNLVKSQVGSRAKKNREKEMTVHCLFHVKIDYKSTCDAAVTCCRHMLRDDAVDATEVERNGISL